MYSSIGGFTLSRSDSTQQNEVLCPRKDNNQKDQYCSFARGSVLRPVLCTGQLDDFPPSTRNQKYVKLGHAWIEPAGSASKLAPSEPWNQAKDYNDHIEHTRQNKAARLQEFQREVQTRVKSMEAKKKQVLLQKTLADIELERKVARKTAFLAQGGILNSADVVVAGRIDTIAKNAEKSVFHPDGLTAKYDETSLNHIASLNQTINSEKENRRVAREKLMSRKLVTSSEENLPGGFWKETSYLEFPAPPDSEGNKTPIGACDELVSQMEQLDTEGYSPSICKKMRHSDRCKTEELQYFISGQEQEEVKKQAVKQRALLRRLYMDIEREQVKEYTKLKEHLDRIYEIKKEKESERKRIESEAHRQSQKDIKTHFMVDDDDAIIGENRAAKEKETKRFIKALRCLLREKLDRLGVDVPPLCSCGSSIWDTHPDTCANNCVYYKNSKGYEKAIQALIKSCDGL